MRPYKVTVVKHGKRHSYNAIAESWYEAWVAAAEEFGIAALVTVRPG